MKNPARVAGNKKLPWHGLLSLRGEVLRPTTCGLIRLLGPCFKTGGSSPSTKTKMSVMDPFGKANVSPRTQKFCIPDAPPADFGGIQPKAPTV